MTGSFCFISLGSQVAFNPNYSEITMLEGNQSLSQAKGKRWRSEAPNDPSGQLRCWLNAYQVRPKSLTQESQEITNHCFKPLSFRIVCYTAKDN